MDVKIEYYMTWSEDTQYKNQTEYQVIIGASVTKWLAHEDLLGHHWYWYEVYVITIVKMISERLEETRKYFQASS